MAAPARRRPALLVAAVVVCLGVAAALVAVLVATRDDPADGDASVVSTADPHAGHDMGAGGTVMPGCEDVSGVMMMLSPSSADSLIGGTCPWPYDTAIETDGGEDDPALTAPFEPRPYQELFDLAADARLGVCNVGRLPDPVGDGFVLGFTIDVRSGSCADGPATASIMAREQVTEAWRDANAHTASASAEGRTFVLGRWVVVLTGDEAVSTTVAERLEAAGAQPVP